jgi:tetratricopeptide (TPR) repeat protein
MYNLLHSACAQGDLNKVKSLLAQGVDVNESDANQQTPIYKAIDNRNVEIVKLLIKNGAKVSRGDSERLTPIAHADRLGFHSGIELYDLLCQQWRVEAKPIAENYFQIGNNFLKAGQYGKAIEEYDLTVMYRYDFSEAYLNRGTAKLHINDTTGACDDWRKAGELGMKSAYRLLWRHYPNEYDIEASTEESKNKIVRGVKGLLNRIGPNATFEALVWRYIQLDSPISTEKAFYALQYGWEKSGHDAEDYCEVYCTVFSSVYANKSEQKGNEEILSQQNYKMQKTNSELALSQSFSSYEKKCILKLLCQLEILGDQTSITARKALNRIAHVLEMPISSEIYDFKITSEEACQSLRNHSEKDWLVTAIFNVATADTKNLQEKNKLLAIYMKNLEISNEEIYRIKNKVNSISTNISNQSVREESTKSQLLFNFLVALAIVVIASIIKSCLK